MSLVQKRSSKELVNSACAQAVHVRSIQIDYKDVQRKHPVTVEIKTDNERARRSRQYKRNEPIDWNVDLCSMLASQLAIVIREHRHLHSDKECIVPLTITYDLFVKAMLVIDEPIGKNTSLRIHFGTAGPFIAVIRQLVEESQERMKNM
ncbi:uncharacterized protein FOMMEDRAFT_22740, partial [Fomitiporia mediterranea MF3/22]|uniref:uncharacterized protein n=1 Tax=Fomitiporia mediterranea (strain MF3/22) TaxID=694068 RepID=UPI000440923E